MIKSRKRVIKWSRGYIEFLINNLTILNNATEDQIQAFCGKTKHDAMANIIAGMQSSLDNELYPNWKTGGLVEAVSGPVK
jgi:hypothetical protein